MAMNPTRDNTTSEEKAKERPTGEITGPDKYVNSSELKSHTAVAPSDSTKNSYY
jgi:hypothetical protein